MSEKICFVVFPIGPENSDIRLRSDQIFEYVIKPALGECGYKAVSIDQFQPPEYITLQVIENLISADLVIADLTARNPIVFYELAIRHSMNKPIIHIKDETDLEQIPFDISGMRTISVDYRFIKKMDKCKEEIIKQIKILEKDPSILNFPFPVIEKPRDSAKMLQEIKVLKQQIDKLEKQNSTEIGNIKEVIYEDNNKRTKEISNQLPTTNSKEVISENEIPISRSRILWVDDNPTNYKEIIDNFMKEVVVDLAKNTSQALSYLSKIKYDLIISDMGRGSSRDEGIKMIKAIKESIPNPPPIYIFCSSIAYEKYGKEAMKEGAVLVTSKVKELIYNIRKNKMPI